MAPIDLKDWLPLDYVPQQAKLWHSKARFVCVVAPRQSGKSLLCFRKIILEAMHRKGRYIYVLPTINQARKVCWKRMCEMLKPLADEVLAMNKSELAFYFKNGSVLTLESGEKRERIEGISITGAIIDESSDQLPGLFDLTVLPAMSQVPDSWVWRVGVPKSNGIGGQDFKETCEKYQNLETFNDQYAYIHWTYANREFREVLRVSLDEKGFKEQALGKWANYAGGCYYAFADDNIMTEDYKIDPCLPILFGFDFNVDWYSIVVAQFKNEMFYVFDEVRLANSNTRAALDVLVAKFGGMAQQYIAYGDAAGRHRQTSADISDYLIIEEEKRIPLKVIFPRINPSVIYRIERVNSFLKTADRTIRLMISPKCRYLIKDLYSVTWKEGERTQDKKNIELTHMCFAGETLVNGQRISEMPEQGQVNTMFGVSNYTNPGMRGYKALVEVTLENGESFRCTPDHLLLTNKGWVRALDSIGTWGYCVTKRISKHKKNRWTPLFSIAKHTLGMADTIKTTVKDCMWRSGSFIKGLFQKACVCTTKILTDAITIFPTLKCYFPQNMPDCTWNAQNGKSNRDEDSTLHETQPLFGISPKKDWLGTESSIKEQKMRFMQKTTQNLAPCVGKSIERGGKQNQCFAQKIAKRRIAEKVALMTWSEIVSGVGKSLLSTDTSKRFSAQNNAQARFVKIVEVKSVEGLHPVFCPTVNNGHFVLDNGLVVSNSDALGYMLITHEEHYGEHKVILMREKDILAEVERRGDGRPQTADSRMEAFIGQKLLAPKSTIFHHGGK